MKKEEKKATNKKKEKIVEDAIPKKKLKLKSGLIKFVILLLVLGILFFVGYKFLGLTMAAILMAGLILFLILGYFLDKPKAKGKKRKTLKIIVIICLAFVILGLIGVSAFLVYIVKQAPDFKEEMLKPKEATIFYDSEGKEYAKVGLELRENIEYDEISEVFIDALVATEDSRFFQHNGFDLMRFVKAAFGQAVGQGDAGGGSTLTMQLSKNVFTTKEASVLKVL